MLLHVRSYYRLLENQRSVSSSQNFHDNCTKHIKLYRRVPEFGVRHSLASTILQKQVKIIHELSWLKRLMGYSLLSGPAFMV